MLKRRSIGCVVLLDVDCAFGAESACSMLERLMRFESSRNAIAPVRFGNRWHVSTFEMFANFGLKLELELKFISRVFELVHRLVHRNRNGLRLLSGKESIL